MSDTDNLEAKFFIGGSDYFKLTQFKNNGLEEVVNIKWVIGNKSYKTKGKISRIDGLINKEIAGINIYAKIDKSLPKIPWASSNDPDAVNSAISSNFSSRFSLSFDCAI